MGEEGEKDEDTWFCLKGSALWNTIHLLLAGKSVTKEETAELYCLSCMQPIRPAHSKACKRKVTRRQALTRLRETGFCHNCIKCSVCEKTKCRDDFTFSDVVRRPYQDRVCIDCSHPECTNPSCKTCKVCRDTSCKKKQCNKKPRALLGKAARSVEADTKDKS